jgi:hypothetical protein
MVLGRVKNFVPAACCSKLLADASVVPRKFVAHKLTGESGFVGQ